MNSFKILDTTLRDGSYSVNNQFTALETRVISQVLDEIGFDFIEIGPGVGMNAQKTLPYAPAESDETYILAAREVVKCSKLGMFFIPGIASFDDMEKAAQLGLDFLRVGANVDESNITFSFLERAKELGLFVCSNLMKSYAVSAKEFAIIAGQCQKAGADAVYLVDSAGGMLPAQVGEYVARAKDLNPAVNIGFHGHDNLGLSISNTLAAIENGATIVDSSIRGLGRSSGNTITEKLVLVLKRIGYDINVNMDKMLSLGDEVVKQYTVKENAMDMVYGYSQFHSAFFPKFKEYAAKHNADVKDLIIEYTKKDKLGVDEAVLDEMAGKLGDADRVSETIRIERKIKKSSCIEEQITILKQVFSEQRLKFGREPFFNISYSKNSNGIKISPTIYTGDKLIFGSAEVKTSEEVQLLIRNLGDSVSSFLIDTKLYSDSDKKNNIYHYYDDRELIVSVVKEYIKAISKNELTKLYTSLTTDIGDKTNMLYGEKVVRTVEIAEANILVVGEENIATELLENGKNLKWVIATKNRIITSELREKYPNVKFIMIDMTFEVFAEMIKQERYRELINQRYGCKEINGVVYCSGGYIGSKGTVVVDNINNVEVQYGIATGDGRIDYFE